MKKALGIFLALSLATSVFAAEPVADLNVADFTGWASVGFGVNLDTGDTGFENATGVVLKINFFGEGDKSTTGDGIWGEVKVKTSVALLKADGASGTKVGLADGAVTIDSAKLHIKDIYVNIKSGGFDYGGDFKYPNALNYGDDDSVNIRNVNGDLLEVDLANDTLPGYSTYDQGISVGYDNDFISASFNINSRSKAGDEKNIVSVRPVDTNVNGAASDATNTKQLPSITNSQEYQIVEGVSGVTLGFIGAKAPDGTYPGSWGRIVLVTYDSEDTNFYTNDYAIGGYLKLTPITDLVLGLGFTTVVSDSIDARPEGHADGEYKNKKGNYGLFAGASYILPITEMYTLEPVITFRQEGKIDEFLTLATHRHLGMGLRFGWGEEKDAKSLLVEFFENDIFYETNEGDEKLLPGISIYTNLHLEKDPLDIEDHYLPLMLTAYSGEIIPNLKLYGMFFVNIATRDGRTNRAIDANVLNDALDSGLQGGLAGSYEIVTGDLTITPALGLLFRMANLTSTEEAEFGRVENGQALAARCEAKVDIDGLIPNILFTLAWEEAGFVNYIVDGTRSNIESNGELKLTTKISL